MSVSAVLHVADERESTHPPHTVLLVEDSADSREALRLLLELEGFRVATAVNGVDAVRLIASEGLRPCIVLLDLVMPVVDGLTFRRQLEGIAGLEKVPVVALTGHEPMRRQAEAEGFFRALLKPTDIDELITLVGEHCPRADAEPTQSAAPKRGA
jgi:two-component system chemotaxis response regulator CheY